MPFFKVLSQGFAQLLNHFGVRPKLILLLADLGMGGPADSKLQNLGLYDLYNKLTGHEVPVPKSNAPLPHTNDQHGLAPNTFALEVAQVEVVHLAFA